MVLHHAATRPLLLQWVTLGPPRLRATRIEHGRGCLRLPIGRPAATVALLSRGFLGAGVDPLGEIGEVNVLGAPLAGLDTVTMQKPVDGRRDEH